MGADIRTQLKNIRKNIEELEVMQRKEAEKLEKKKTKVQSLSRITSFTFKKGKKIDPSWEKSVEVKAEIVELAYKHLEECKMLESSAFGNNYTSHDDIPLATVTKLPDVDDPQFQEFIRNDELIVSKMHHYITVDSFLGQKTRSD
ncbi:MAG: hypothetical protein ACK42G_10075 [Candidatus Kapaibacteriota bacterium]